MNTHHVAIHGDHGNVIGEASSKNEAIALCKSFGHTVVPENDGGQIDFYDAEDGPAVQGYETDGKGVWIVCCDD